MLESRRLLSTTLFVDAAAPGPRHDGSSWASAFGHLQAALKAASAGTTIEVAKGTYKPTSGISRTATFQLIDGVTLEGGFAGNGAVDPDARDIAENTTILPGDIGALGNNSDNSYNIVTGNGTDSSAILNGFTVTAGNGNGNGNTIQGGGGLSSFNGSPTISNCDFTGNFAFYGGAMFFGISGSGTSAPTITHCVFNNNSAGQGGGAGGGAIFDANSSMTVVDCTFIDNHSTTYGGAINSPFSSSLIANCTFTGNTGNTGSAIVDADTGGTILVNCILWGDTGGSEIDALQGTHTSATNSDVQGGFSGNGNIDADPQFIDEANGNVKLQSTSPCIDAGNNASVPAGVTTDLVGRPRILDGTVDMGAFEFGPAYDITDQPTRATAGVLLDPIVVQLDNVMGQVRTRNHSDVTLSILKGPTGAVLEGVTTVAANDGVATFTGLHLNVAGAYHLMVAGNLANTPLARFQVLSASPIKMVFAQPPTNTTAGVAMAPAVRVDVEDGFGNIATASDAKITLSLRNGPAGAIVDGTFSVAAINGVATFSDVLLNTAGQYKLSAISAGLPETAPVQLTVTHAAAARLAFIQEPANEKAGLAFQPPITVAVEDAVGNVIGEDNSTITLAFARNPANAIFRVLTLAAVGGEAVFSSELLLTPGIYRLFATDGSLAPVESVRFTVTPTG